MKKHIISVIISLSLLFCVIISTPAQAQFLEKSTKSRDVAMLFHKMGGLGLNFEEWAMDTKEYSTAVEEMKQDVLREEMLSIQLKYSELNEKQADIIIRTQVAAKIDTRKDTKGLVMDFSAEGPLFFPYKYLGEDYALIAKNIDLLKFIPLGNLESAYIGNKLSSHGKTYMILKLRPYRVDTKSKTPIPDHNMEFWMMLSKVASIHLYNKDIETLWSWTADWYIAEQEE